MINLDHDTAVARYVHETLGTGFPDVHDVARAVETYCQLYFPDRPLSSDYLSLLLSRALVKSGHPQQARCVLSKRTGADACLAALAQDECPHRVMAGLSSQLIRPTRWAVSNGEVVWTLDFRRLKQDSLAGLEISFLPAVRALLDEAAPMWDESSGRGGIALRGLDGLAVDGDSVRAFCADWLAATALQRGWTSTPALLSLDCSRDR